MPILNDKDGAVFVGRIEEVFPRNLSTYESRWKRVYPQKFTEENQPTAEQTRDFMLQLWPGLFSREERNRMDAAKNLDDLEDAVFPMWLFPRRIRVRVEESFAGPKGGVMVLYTGVGGGDCGVEFKKGQRWLIDASLDSAQRWIARVCSRTQPVNQATDILARLRAQRH